MRILNGFIVGHCCDEMHRLHNAGVLEVHDDKCWLTTRSWFGFEWEHSRGTVNAGPRYERIAIMNFCPFCGEKISEVK